MSQITTGLRSILSIPWVYDFFQNVMGARNGRRQLVREHIRPVSGNRLLDIGCGTARILDFMSNIDYYGFDLSQRYIDDASRRYGARGVFTCALVEQTVIDHMEPFDIIIAAGMLHHLDDGQAHGLMRLAYSALKDDGRLVTIDPSFADDQSSSARFLVSRDRGQSVRLAQGYCDLASEVFTQVKGEVKHQAWIPYTHWIMVCQK